ncbi:hypothetical protein KKC88_04820 [Patescibacteria group bacterium]|nr:hypothetical protein [Patescibacteria group bacterium]MBU1673223.1 hypothetical protein [Patescibacteria group bacterium]MBU1964019.1 hypothetical protein [Patescibacteria group bacterium]
MSLERGAEKLKLPEVDDLKRLSKLLSSSQFEVQRRNVARHDTEKIRSIGEQRRKNAEDLEAGRISDDLFYEMDGILVEEHMSLHPGASIEKTLAQLYGIPFEEAQDIVRKVELFRKSPDLGLEKPKFLTKLKKVMGPEWDKKIDEFFALLAANRDRDIFGVPAKDFVPLSGEDSAIAYRINELSRKDIFVFLDGDTTDQTNQVRLIDRRQAKAVLSIIDYYKKVELI